MSITSILSAQTIRCGYDDFAQNQNSSSPNYSMQQQSSIYAFTEPFDLQGLNPGVYTVVLYLNGEVKSKSTLKL